MINSIYAIGEGSAEGSLMNKCKCISGVLRRVPVFKNRPEKAWSRQVQEAAVGLTKAFAAVAGCSEPRNKLNGCFIIQVRLVVEQIFFIT